MYYCHHASPHFRRIHGVQVAVSIETGEILDGRLPRRARSLVSEWTAAHRGDLQNVWELAREAQPLPAVAGLE